MRSTRYTTGISSIVMFRLALRAAPRAVPRATAAPIAARAYSAAALTKEDITKRVMDVLRSFEKVDQGKVCRLPLPDGDLGVTRGPRCAQECGPRSK